MSAEPIIALDQVSRRFVRKADLAARILNLFGASHRDEVVHAVDGLSFGIAQGEVVGLVGESGCGKSTVGRMVADILAPSSGTIRFRGNGDARARPPLAVQMIFQDPMSSLNPRKRVGSIVGEAVKVHAIVPRAEMDDYVASLMERCGVDPGARQRFPHQFSGGQRQRIGIARALAVKPEVLVCDEAISALDVSIQAQILNLFMDLKDAFGLTYLFISHDLGVVEHISDRVVVMYLGRAVEIAPTAELFNRPNHPYTQALLAEAPRLDRRRLTFAAVKGEIPSPLNPPSGCHFHPRCPRAMARCAVEAPQMRQIAPGHQAACHLNDA
jgi:peptide/nickel transport system ATP-binding protein